MLKLKILGLVALVVCWLFPSCQNFETGQERNKFVEKTQEQEELQTRNNTAQELKAIDYSNISKQHLTSDNGIRYEINLGWDKNTAIDREREDFFYKYGDEKTIIYDSWLEYGFMNGIYPCRPNCNINLYAVGSEINHPIEDAQLIVDSQNVCGDVLPLIWIEHKKPAMEPLFITSMAVESDSKKYYKEAGLEETSIPEWLNLSVLETPKNTKNKKVTLYNYVGKQDCFLAEVTAEAWYESKDVEKFGPSKEIKWQGIYYVEKNKQLILTPIDNIQQQYYGDDFSLSGLEDINGDGLLDIIIGKPVSLILESYKNGFRSWGFAFRPKGGC